MNYEYEATIRWTGNQGSGTSAYDAYSRDHVIEIDGKPPIAASADPAFRGDPARHNPEELLLASLSSCHMLWYLHLAAVNKIVVTAYTDRAQGFMEMPKGGTGHFTRAILRPEVTISSGDAALAARLHKTASEHCFIANSVNFPVEHTPRIINGF